METVKLKIRGRVQGVFFRHSTREKANSLGLAGWVRNTLDGCVEVEATGPADKVEQLLEWCKQGPPSAHVETVEVESRDSANQEHSNRGFEIR